MKPDQDRILDPDLRRCGWSCTVPPSWWNIHPPFHVGANQSSAYFSLSFSLFEGPVAIWPLQSGPAEARHRTSMSHSSGESQFGGPAGGLYRGRGLRGLVVNVSRRDAGLDKKSREAVSGTVRPVRFSPPCQGTPLRQLPRLSGPQAPMSAS